MSYYGFLPRDHERDRARDRGSDERDDSDRRLDIREMDELDEEIRNRIVNLNPGRRPRSDAPAHVVCIDGSEGADRALKYALKNAPRDHRLLLAHGVHRWSPKGTGTRVIPEHLPQFMDMDHDYLKTCKRAGRDCEVWHFYYATYTGFGEGVCRFARFNRAKSVITGRRGHISDMRRAVLGSSSQSVLSQCEVPVSIISEE